jgi:hypothetical protein
MPAAMLPESQYTGCSRVLFITIVLLVAYMLGPSALVVGDGRQSIAAETGGSWEESGMQGLSVISRRD